MARQGRKESPTGYYHIMMRGNNREEIFKTSEQKKYFITLLREQSQVLMDIAAYCIMDNHVHILIKSEKLNLAEALKRINIKYAMKYNYSNNRVGHVFQDRYRSESISDEIYLCQVIRYVHNNPIKAKLAEHACDYPWCSYREYLEDVHVISKNQKDFILSLFSNSQELFREFHLERDHNEYLDTKEEIQRNQLLRAEEIIDLLCKVKGTEKGKQIIKDPERLQEIIIELLDKTKLSHREIAKLLGVSTNSVHKANLTKRG